MAIAPFHGRQFRLLFVRNMRTEWPRYSAADVRSARLSTRARRERRKRVSRMMLLSFLLTGLFLTVVAAVVWMMLFLRG
jgi:hypothetical protein